jgi:hypothetical protein
MILIIKKEFFISLFKYNILIEIIDKFKIVKIGKIVQKNSIF